MEAGRGPNDDPDAPRYLMEQLGLRGDQNPAGLSGGEGRRAALVRALAPSPDILLLDEPTNHLDLPAIEWLEGELAARKAARGPHAAGKLDLLADNLIAWRAARSAQRGCFRIQQTQRGDEA